MTLIVGLFAAAEEAIQEACKTKDTGLRVVHIQGPASSGKKTVALNVIEKSETPISTVNLEELSCGGLDILVKRLQDIASAVFIGFDDLDQRARDVIQDLVITLKFRNLKEPRVWIIPSKSDIAFADIRVDLPALSSSPSTRACACEGLLSAFPLHAECRVKEILYQSTKRLSIGQLVSLVNTAKMYAMSISSPLSCSHICEAFHSLNLPSSEVVDVATNSSSDHTCDFWLNKSSATRIDSFIGLTDEVRESISDFTSNPTSRYKVLLISGPVGSGKSYLASAIASNAIVPPTVVTSADILRSRIGDTEKNLHRYLSETQRIIIEDIDKLVPEDISESTGSVQRCLPVLISFLDELRWLSDSTGERMIIGTCRDEVHALVDAKSIRIRLDNKLSFSDKILLIKSAFPDFNESSVNSIDLIPLKNRSECIQFGREKKMELLRSSISRLHLS